MKVLFLDVGGVLVHSKSIEGGNSCGEPFGSSFYYAATVDLACVQRVMRIVTETGAKIVVTSDWRLHTAQETGLRRAFYNAGLDRRKQRELFLTPTPKIGDDRGAEISAWLKLHPEVTQYVILDDHPVEGFQVIRTDYFEGGLTDSHVDRAIYALQRLPEFP